MQRKLLLIACVFICVSAIAQQYSFVRFTIENGLSNNVVYSTRQDSKGYLWVATHDGLNRYDGYSFRKFVHSPFDRKSLSGNMTIDLAEDNEGRIWVLTNTHLHLYNPKDESFVQYKLPVGVINHSNQSSSKMIDGSNRYLLLNLFNGLFVFDKRSLNFRPLPVESDRQENTDLFGYPFFKDHDGNVLIGAGALKGVLWFDTVNVRLIKRLPDRYQKQQWQNDTVTSVYVNKKNNLVYCVQKGNRFSLVTEKGKRHFLQNRSIAGITVFIESVGEDEQGNIWIGYDNRLFEYIPDVDSIIDVSKSMYGTSMGDNFIIKDMCIDNFSNLWLGLYEAGIMKTSLRQSLFINFAISKKGNYQLPYSSIYGLIKNPDETVVVRYFGTQMATILDPVNKRLVKREFKFNPLDTIVLKQLFPQFRQVQLPMPFYKYFDASTRLTFNNGQFGLYKDSEQNFWAVNFNEFRRIGDDRVFNISDHINCFYEGDSNTFWIGSDGSGLLELNYHSGKIKKYLPHESDRSSISSEFVNAVIPDGQKGLWLGTRYGLNYLDFHTGKFTLYSEENGLCSNTIYTMEKDREGKLWLGTSNGLSCYDPHSKEFTNYSKNNGLVNSEYNRNGTISLSDGWILMGGTEGIDVVIPDSIKYRNAIAKKNPPLQITDFKSSDSSYHSFADPIRLSHNQNNIEISFAALDLTQPSNNKYLWKLEPVDKKWTYGLGKHEVNYAGLPPGNYTFKVKATGADGIWNDREVILPFVIVAPWWKSWWALLITILLGIGFLSGILRLYYYGKFKKQLQKQKLILEKQQAVEKERNRIAADMHDDLGAGLSSLRFLSEKIKRNSFGDVTKHDIEKLQYTSGELMDKMNEIIWATNEKNDSLEDLLFYARSYAKEYCDENNLECHIEMPDQIPSLFVNGEVRRNVFLIIKESLHNIVKHAKATRVCIEISLDNKLRIKIQDNGKGFSAVEEKSTGGNGLRNMQKRVSAIDGMVTVENGEGVTVEVIVPLPG